MTRVRLSVDVEPELRRRVRIAAASSDQSVKEWLEGVLERELKRELEREPGRELGRTREDVAWMESDLSNLGGFEPYEWAEGELEEGGPVRHVSGHGLRVMEQEESEPRAEQQATGAATSDAKGDADVRTGQEEEPDGK